jgi:hypothetical protein
MALLAFGGTSAFAQCKPVPKPVRNYLKAHPTWSIVDAGDLNPADRLAWRRLHRGACPGLAAAALDGGKENSYAIAASNQARGIRTERLILLEARGKKLTPKTLIPAFPVGEPIVVWRAKGRTVREFGSRKRIAIAHDSIVFEKLGMSSKVFFREGGRIRTVLVAN